MTSAADGDPDGVDSRELLKRGAVALVLALVANWLVLYAVVSLELAPPFQALEFPSVSLFTALGVAGATVVYGALTRTSESPDEALLKVAVVVLLVSFVPDAGLYVFVPGATAAVASVLAFMHVTVAAACVVGLTEYIDLP